MLAIRKGCYPGWAVALLLVLGIGLCVPAQVQAQKRKKGSFFDRDKNEVQFKTAAKFLEAFRPVVDRVSASTVRVLCNGDDRALGVVVAENGYILTQLHDLSGKITVKLKNGTIKDAEVVGSHVRHDLALLKITAADLKPIVWGDSKTAPVGNFVVSVGPTVDPLAVGVVSVAPRGPVFMKPGPNAGFLGIALADDPLGAKVGFADPKEAGARAGLKANDIVLSVAGKRTPDSEALIRNVQRFKVGEIIELKIKRGTEELTLKATLGKRKQDVGEIQNNMGSRLSKLRGGYPMALQHDTVLQPTDCGSPLVDLEGNVVGINISRYGRVETYAIPAEVVRPLLTEMMASKQTKEETKK